MLGGKTWEETSQEAAFPIHAFGSAGGLEGSILIHVNNTLSNELQDILPALIKNLCFEVTRELQTEDHAIYHFYSYPDQVHFSRQGDEISITGSEEIHPASYNAKELTTGLYNCGRRFIDMMHHFCATDSENAAAYALPSLIDLLETTAADHPNR